jgi:hypothetical protein
MLKLVLQYVEEISKESKVDQEKDEHNKHDESSFLVCTFGMKMYYKHENHSKMPK